VKDGFSVVEALVALLLTAVALAGLTAAAATTTRQLRLARDRVSALELAAARVDALRAGPRGSDADEVESAGTRFSRTWQTDEDRGGPVRLHVEVTWPDGHVILESEAFP
jgi:Tfp pilus assembly protein PilV